MSSEVSESESQKIASEQWKNGEYYPAARTWYQMVYLSPLAERFYFIVIGVFSFVVFLFALMAVKGLMPLSPPEAIYYGSADAEYIEPQISKMRRSVDQTPDDALLRFFLQQYVEQREGYDAERFGLAGRFIQNYSEAGEWSQYQRLVDNSNPRSPARLYARNDTRVIEVQSIQLNSPDNPTRAVVYYGATVETATERQKSYWTASVRFTYSGIQENPDAEEGVRYGMPDFQVLEYESKEQVHR